MTSVLSLALLFASVAARLIRSCLPTGMCLPPLGSATAAPGGRHPPLSSTLQRGVAPPLQHTRAPTRPVRAGTPLWLTTAAGCANRRHASAPFELEVRPPATKPRNIQDSCPIIHNPRKKVQIGPPAPFKKYYSPGNPHSPSGSDD